MSLRLQRIPSIASCELILYHIPTLSTFLQSHFTIIILHDGISTGRKSHSHRSRVHSRYFSKDIRTRASSYGSIRGQIKAMGASDPVMLQKQRASRGVTHVDRVEQHLMTKMKVLLLTQLKKYSAAGSSGR